MWSRAEIGAFLLAMSPAGLHFPGLTKTQSLRVVGFVLIVVGAALFLAVRRRQRRKRYLTELIHRPEEPDLRDWIRGA